MAVTRTVTMPLSREPEILFGLRLMDLIWVMAAAVGDLASWHTIRGSWTLRIMVMVGIALIGLILALVRISDATLPEWGLRYARYLLSPHLFLP